MNAANAPGRGSRRLADAATAAALGMNGVRAAMKFIASQRAVFCLK
jgi:hypothetical protein